MIYTTKMMHVHQADDEEDEEDVEVQTQQTALPPEFVHVIQEIEVILKNDIALWEAFIEFYRQLLNDVTNNDRNSEIPSYFLGRADERFEIRKQMEEILKTHSTFEKS